MTREEQIIKSSEEYEKAEGAWAQPCTTENFIDGAEWADKNPKCSWISVKDDLPCNHEELILYGSYTKRVLVSDHEGCVGLLKMEKRSNGIIGVEPWWQWEIPSVIYYWMPIPELPKE